MRTINQHPTALTLAILFSALVMGFVASWVSLRPDTTQAQANEVNDSNFEAPSNTLGSREINVTPTIARNQVGERHTITATVTTTGTQPVTGVNVAFRIIAGPNSGLGDSGTTGANGTTTFTYASEKVGIDTIAACFTDGSGNRACDLAAKRWTEPPPPPALRLSPSRDTNPVGSQHTLTATVAARGDRDQLLEGVPVDFRVIVGPTAGVTGSDTTDVNGEAFFTYTGVNVGTDIIVACADPEVSNRACDWAIKRWTAPDDTPGDGTSCQGEGSCRGRNISVGENSCNGENSCRGNNLAIGDNSCNEERSCNGNNQSVGDDSCNGEEACRGNRSRIGDDSCNDEEACSGNNNSVGHNSCNGGESCVGNNGNVGDNACNTDEACPGRGKRGNNNDEGDRDDDDNGNNRGNRDRDNDEDDEDEDD